MHFAGHGSQACNVIGPEAFGKRVAGEKAGYDFGTHKHLRVVVGIAPYNSIFGPFEVKCNGRFGAGDLTRGREDAERRNAEVTKKRFHGRGAGAPRVKAEGG